jgi:metal-sulfur cluster biosynthetic enzyme
MDEQVLQALRHVIDPELRINIVDLGLVYSAERQDGHVHVAMTLTTPGCPMATQILNMAEAAIWQRVPDVQSVDVELVWSPRWQQTMMSEEAKDQLGWL